MSDNGRFIGAVSQASAVGIALMQCYLLAAEHRI